MYHARCCRRRNSDVAVSRTAAVSAHRRTDTSRSTERRTSEGELTDDRRQEQGRTGHAAGQTRIRPSASWTRPPARSVGRSVGHYGRYRYRLLDGCCLVALDVVDRRLRTRRALFQIVERSATWARGGQTDGRSRREFDRLAIAARFKRLIFGRPATTDRQMRVDRVATRIGRLARARAHG